MLKEPPVRPTKLHFAICFTVLLFMGLIALICWLSLRPSRPEFQIHHFTIVGLGQADGFESTRIVFNVSVRNPNRRLRISYESLSASVYYGGERIGSTPSLYSFDQPPENTSYVHHVLTGGVMAGNYGQPWMEIVSDRAQGWWTSGWS
ncbi:unnamed protein product [Linum trigynum]|uniref:Late embryogenesis abundant protein LEA-2 subgroup domain-containing protein n=1 Tax=Linum trigynum TaxID=586398 RepID=A0AAV2FID0_9ROSI